MGEDEIKLVRKKLKWKYEPFKIPEKILNEWRSIGIKASKKASLSQKNYKPKNKQIDKSIYLKLKNKI